jgi:hypothetical protein
LIPVEYLSCGKHEECSNEFTGVVIGSARIRFFSLAINIDETIADRYLEALTGTGVIIVGAFIWRRVPGNRIGPLLILYGVGIAGYATRADLGSPQLTSMAHLTWEVYYGGVAIPALIVLILSFPRDVSILAGQRA